ncbi:MAG: hypothetical protein K2Q13_12750 [Nitrosomonas sp.]|uniref:hypothetical protein n=1 Tax=Nitrosomonas sp. TaxID=42353 RepID=UPI0025FB4B81|nr:hypothetical protein [Nitrosomonas sp.]MBY0475899.1 hypothetical protein [Nitrosomonas sp.]
MNRDESVAKNYLEKYYDNVKFEPDGNIPPDFLIENSIGVEVRRLNQQHYYANGETEGLEETAIPLCNKVKKVLSNYDAEAGGNNFWVGLCYERDKGKLDVSEKKIKEAIDAFHSQNEAIPYKYKIGENVLLEFIAKGSVTTHRYELGSEIDLDSGGWIANVCSDAIRHCIEEKEIKIMPYIARYDRWWLLLVDHMSYTKSEDQVDIVKCITKPSCFERIIIVNYDGTSKPIDSSIYLGR